MAKAILLDVMRGGQFICQLKYTEHGYHQKIDGKLVEVHSEQKIKSFVEGCLPSLKGTDYNVCFSDCEVRHR